MKHLIYDPFTENHTFLVNSLIHNLDLFNYKSEKISKITNKQNGIFIVFINHMFLIENNSAIDDYQELLKKRHKILYITEPIELIIEKKFYNKIINELKPLKVLTYCEENLTKIRPICNYINQYIINENYLKFIDVNAPFLQKKDLTKIVFIGKLNDYRNKIKDIFKDDLIIIENKYKKEEWIEIISKYQYFINIHRRPNSKCLETMRIIPLLYNGCSIISEHVNFKEEKYLKNNNIYFCNLEKMKVMFDEIKNIKLDEIISNTKKIDFTKYIRMNSFFEG